MISLKFRENLWSGIVSIIMGIIVYFIIPFQIKVRDIKLSNAIPPNYVPLLIAYAMILLGGVLIIKSLAFKKDKYITLQLDGELHALLYFAVVLAYVVLMPLIGFLPSSLLFCTGALMFMRIKKTAYYIFINGIAVFLWFSFKYLLNVPLP